MTFAPSISIIIAVKNAKNFLLETLDSIRLQQYPFLEVIVIDGGSVDGTVDLIKQNTDIIHQFSSEPDQGISDAFNKGLKLATGEYINFQGAGDILYAPHCLTNIFSDLDSSYQLVCGKVMRVREDGQTPIWIAPKKVGVFNPRSLRYRMSLPHQALFTHASFFKKYGHFDLRSRFAMDYELLLRAYHDFPKTIIKNVMISRWRAGGVGTDKILEVFDEYHRIKKQHKISNNFSLKLIDHSTRFKYAIKTRYLKYFNIEY